MLSKILPYNFHWFFLFFVICQPVSFIWAASNSPRGVQDASTISGTDEPGALTLRECYALALKQSETVAIHKEVIKEAEGRFLQALSTVLPTANFQYSDERQDANAGSSNAPFSSESKFIFSQPLFTGFKEFAGIGAGRAEKRQRIQEEKRAELLLLQNVTDAFYLLMSYQDGYVVLLKTQAALDQRIQELTKRVHLGRSRASEIASAKSKLARNKAQIEQILSDQDVALQLLEFLTGRSEITGIKDEELIDTTGRTVSDYIKLVDQRPDIQALKEAALISKKLVIVAKSDAWPKVTLDGNSYTKRPVSLEGVDWDVTFKVNVPLFEGGNNVGKAKEAQAKSNEAQLTFEQARRQSITEIQSNYIRWVRAIKRQKAYQEARDAAQKNYDLQIEDSRLNLVNNLDVLQALEDLQTAEIDYLTARDETRRFYIALKVAVGETLE